MKQRLFGVTDAHVQIAGYTLEARVGERGMGVRAVDEVLGPAHRPPEL